MCTFNLTDVHICAIILVTTYIYCEEKVWIKIGKLSRIFLIMRILLLTSVNCGKTAYRWQNCAENLMLKELLYIE